MKKLLALFYMIFLGSLCGLRYFISGSMIDRSTGFYISSSPVITVQNILLLAAVAVFLLLPIIIYRDRYELKAVSRISGALLMLFSAGISVYTVLEIFGNTDALAMLFSDQWFKSLTDILPIFFGAVTAVGFMFAGVLGAMGNRALRSCVWVFGVSVVWLIVMVALNFIKYTATLTVSAQLFELMFYLASAMFMLGHFGAMCRIYPGKSISYMVIGGFMGSVFAALLIADGINKVASGYVLTLPDISKAVLFATFMVYEMYFSLYCLFKSKPYVRHIAEEEGSESKNESVN